MSPVKPLDPGKEIVGDDPVCEPGHHAREHDLRSEIDALISAQDAGSATVRMSALWRQQPTLATANYLALRIDKLRRLSPLQTLRVAFMRSFTIEPLIPLLRASAFAYHLDLQIQAGDFNTYMQDVLDGDSSLYHFKPDVGVLAVRTPDIAPELWSDYSAFALVSASEIADRACSHLRQVVAAFRERSSAELIVHTLEQPLRPAMGVLDSQLEFSQSEAIQAINRAIRRFAREYRGVYVLEYDALVARHGRLGWQDERKLLSVRLPIAAHQLIHLGNELLRFLIPLSGRTAKVLVVDLDNTIWGGVVGEEGVSGIMLGAEYPGAAYQALQKVLLDLSRAGILLAVCSKNNFDDAMDVFKKHPGMVLRATDFAAIRINWNDKVQGLREIAAELNVGIESLAFLDDNPFEREQVRSTLPEVVVIDLPEERLQYAAAVRDCPALERLALSAEDRSRREFYKAQQDRTQSEQTFTSKEDFFRYLQQEAEIASVNPSTRSRVSQLTQKTNQFNLTARRYSERQIEKLAATPGCNVLSLRLRDRFGDQGLVGVAITFDKDELCELDSFLLSCRVIGRSVENALLAHIAAGAIARGCTRLAGWFLPTKKNAPAKDFFQRSGFECTLQDDEGSRWILDLQNHQISSPEWINLTVGNEGSSDFGHP